MKKICLPEFGLLMIAIMFLLAGIIWFVHPVGVGSVEVVKYRNGQSPRLDRISTVTSSKFYGVIAILLGIGIGTFVLYRPKDQVPAKLPHPHKRIRHGSAKPKK